MKLDPLSFYKALADETRLKSVLLISLEQELCVCELTTALDLSQPKISRHLSQLKQASILADRRQGQWIYYRLSDDLPDWAKQVIETTVSENADFVADACDALTEMGDRPVRKTVCC